MAVNVCGLLLLLAILTVSQEQRWATDLSLWEAAVKVNRTSPRPAYNLALALRKDHRYDRAAFWLVETVERARGSADEAAIRARVRDQFAAIELEGYLICDSASARPYCY